MGVMDLLALLVFASLGVLVIKNPNGFATDVSSAGGFIQGESKILSGG